MRRGAWVALLLFLAGLLAFGWRVETKRDQATPTDCAAKPAILLDPGHGGIDGGANRAGLLEKEIVLDVALRVEQELLAQEIPVLLTRRSDIDLGGKHDSGRLRRDLNHRIRIANSCRAAFVLSIHVNSAANEAERGMMLFYQPTPWGRDAAYLLADRLQPLHGRRERPIPRGDFALLRGPIAPAVLVELGFITHPAERQQLAEAGYRKRIAQELAAGLAEIYREWVEEGRP